MYFHQNEVFFFFEKKVRNMIERLYQKGLDGKYFVASPKWVNNNDKWSNYLVYEKSFSFIRWQYCIVAWAGSQ